MKSLLCIGIILALSCCSPVQRYDSSFLAMGTRMDMLLMTDSAERAAQTTEDVERVMTQWSKDWYPWGDIPGELKQLNAALASGHSFTASKQLRELLQKATALSIGSDGYFDPAVAPMIKLWGMDAPDHAPASLPSEQALADWTHQHPTISDLIIDGNEVSSACSNVQLDMGAIAKGYALDLITQQLQQHNIAAATLNIGGQILVFGNMDITSRTVDIRDPYSSSPLATVTLNNGESISTSGDYERYFVVDGQRIHHLLDPHTGRPVNTTRWVTVITNTGTLADAASTAVMAAGEDWQRIAKQLGVSQVLRVAASGEIQVTTAMYARLTRNHFPSTFLLVKN